MGDDDAGGRRFDSLERERDRLAARVAELEGAKAALEEQLERREAALADARREALEGRAAAAELDAARREAETALAELESLRRQHDRMRTERALSERVHDAAARIAGGDGASVVDAPSTRQPSRRPGSMPSMFRLSPRTERRLRKLQRDPKQFLEDSKFPLARRLGRLLFR